MAVVLAWDSYEPHTGLGRNRAFVAKGGMRSSTLQSERAL
jgi:hypothetical protein